MSFTYHKVVIISEFYKLSELIAGCSPKTKEDIIHCANIIQDGREIIMSLSAFLEAVDTWGGKTRWMNAWVQKIKTECPSGNVKLDVPYEM